MSDLDGNSGLTAGMRSTHRAQPARFAQQSIGAAADPGPPTEPLDMIALFTALAAGTSPDTRPRSAPM